MLAEKNEFLQEAAQSVYVANEDEIIQDMCLAREERERHERTIQRDLKRLQKLEKTVAEKDYELAVKSHQLAEKDHELEELRARLAQYEDV